MDIFFDVYLSLFFALVSAFAPCEWTPSHTRSNVTNELETDKDRINQYDLIVGRLWSAESF